MVFYILLKMTDAEHPMETQKIKEILSSFGIPAENLSIQRDIKNLRYLLDGEEYNQDALLDVLFDLLNDETEYDEEQIEKLLSLGYEISFDGSINNKSGTRGFKVSKRPYTTNDLWLLIEAVNGLKSVSETTSEHLKTVILSLANIYEIPSLSVETFVPEKHETSRDKVLMNLPVINDAIKMNKQISFEYNRYKFNGKKIEIQPNKNRSIISPIKLIYNNGYYYIMGFISSKSSDKKPKERLYRLDKMAKVRITEDDRIEEVHTEVINLEAFSKRAFNMFQGRNIRVRIQFTDDLLDTIVERFGVNNPDVVYQKVDDTHFAVYTPIEVSDQFYSWICGFRKKARIVSPASVVDGFHKFLEDISGRYEK